MRNFLALLAVTVLVAAFPCQSLCGESVVEYGVKAGLSVSDIISEGIYSSPKPGFVGGAFANIRLGEVWLRLEGLYVMKGYSVDDWDDWRVNLDYVEIPILIQYRIPTHKRVRLFVAAGPSVAFNVRAESHGEDASEFVNSAEFGVSLGGGLSMPVGRGEVIVDFRVTVGLTDTFDADMPTIVEGGKNICFALTVGYGIQ